MIGWAVIGLLGAWASLRHAAVVIGNEIAAGRIAMPENPTLRTAEELARAQRKIGAPGNPLAVNLSAYLPKRSGG